VNPYYSEESEVKLTEVLSSPQKLEAFVAELEAEMPEVDSSVIKNYEMLILLLRPLSKSDF
jgi:hypothetical protein